MGNIFTCYLYSTDIATLSNDFMIALSQNDINAKIQLNNYLVNLQKTHKYLRGNLESRNIALVMDELTHNIVVKRHYNDYYGFIEGYPSELPLDFIKKDVIKLID